MSERNPSISVNVDPTNPGQFFACCGLLELADRLWPGAEGWFAGGRFHITCRGTLTELMSRFILSKIESTLPATQRARLATLLSLAESKLSAADLDDKARLKEMWKYERLHLTEPFDFWIDWWRDERGERTELKTWAAKQMVADMAQDMLKTIGEAPWSRTPNPVDLFPLVSADSLPFNFDSDLSRQGAARDTGFSADTLGLKSAFRPLLEFLAFLAFQRFRPTPVAGDTLCFCVWSPPLPPSVAAAAATGLIDVPGQRYVFSLFSRTKYMKAFLPAQLQRGAQ